MVEIAFARNTEIVAVASGKGGTGKTLILASLGYALQTSGHRVLFIDTDTATDGLSLFMLGPRGWEAISNLQPQNTFSEYLRANQNSQANGDWAVPFKVNRGRQDDHGQVYALLVSGKGLYGDVSSELNQSADPQLTRQAFRHAIEQLLDSLRSSNQWDYVLIDTRGGFGFNTTDVCALSDSFFLVTEPDFTSFYQDKNLIFRVSAAAAELARKPVLRGVIVNKATEFSPNEEGSLLGLHNLDLDKMEASFRNVLVEEFKIRYSDTHPVPLDLEAVQAYKSQKIPYLACPSSTFSYATLVAFSNLLRTVTVRWPDEVTKRWNALVDRISEAIKSENERKLQRAREQGALREGNRKLGRENTFLKEQIAELKASVERSETTAERETRVERIRFITSILTVSLIVGFGALGLWFFETTRKSADAELRIRRTEIQDYTDVLRKQLQEQAQQIQEQTKRLQAQAEQSQYELQKIQDQARAQAGTQDRGETKWTTGGLVADWTDRDSEPCTPGSAPAADRCGLQVVGKVAVCWDGEVFKNHSYPAGSLGDSCRNQDRWCTYKDFSKVNVNTTPDGGAPGRVFLCSK